MDAAGTEEHAYLFCCTIEALQVIIVALIFRHDMDDYVAKVQHFPTPTAKPGLVWILLFPFKTDVKPCFY